MLVFIIHVCETFMWLGRILCYSRVALKFSHVVFIIIRWQQPILYTFQVFLVVLISCRTCSTDSWGNLPLRLVVEEKLDKIMMTSSGWCNANIQYKMLLELFVVLKGSFMSRQMQHVVNKSACKLARPFI